LAFEKKSIKTETVKNEEVSNSPSEDEILFTRSNQKQRYFEDNSNIKCFKCGKKGHFQSMCPNRSKVWNALLCNLIRSATFALETMSDEIVHLKSASIVGRRDISEETADNPDTRSA
jgi:hypothetical protein